MPYSFSQNGEDILLWRCFKHVRRGFYVDVGASSPVDSSVTELFYHVGWDGINLEPVPERFAELRRARPRDINLCVAAGDQRGEITLSRDPGLGALSSVLPSHSERGPWEIKSTMVLLSDVLEEHGVEKIEFLKIDAEGAERQVLAGLDLARWRPVVILVEATEALTPQANHHLWEGILTSQGYEHLWFDGLNRFYGAREHLPSLKPHFLSPPNVFDQFVSFKALGSPLTNPMHPDYGFALNFAKLLLRSFGKETDDYLEELIWADYSPALRDAPASPETITRLYKVILNRVPRPKDLEALAPSISGRELTRHLLKTSEFLTRRSRVSI